jgi:glyoxylase-like metal-dependent hydrolase (beta-lactamase superfamily II)
MSLNIQQIGGIGYDSNIYFIDCTKPILIDTGTGFHSNDTLEKLNNLKHIDKLSKIILTHNHADHSGGADKISSEYGVKLHAHEADGKALVQGNGNITGATMFGFDQPKLEIEFVEERSMIDCGDFELRVIHTPGHSPGSISLFDEDTQSLICGDLAFMDGGVGRWDLPGGDYKTLVSSYEKVLKLDIKNFYPGHGPGNEGDAKKYIEMSYRYLKSCEAFA